MTLNSAANTIVSCCLIGVCVGTFATTRESQPKLSHQRVMTWQHEDGSSRPVLSAAHWATRRQQILDGFQDAAGALPERPDSWNWDVQVVSDETIDAVRRLSLTIAVEETDRLPLDLYLPGTLALPEAAPDILSLTSSAPHAAMLALHPTGAAGRRIVAGEGGKPGRQYGIELARRGYVTLCPDYPSFGDYDYDFESDRFQSGTMKGIFNHIRCVDFLTELTFVDPERVGVIGHSLGGHNAIFLGVFDERLKVIVSSCGWTPFHDYYGGDIRGWTSPRYLPRLKDVYDLDPDQVPFDFYELVAALAPRTFVSVSPLHDSNFDVGGVRKAIPEAARVYSLLDAEDNLILKTPDCEHDFPTDMRKQCYAIIDRVLEHKPLQEVTAGYADELPRIAPLEPDAALESFQVADGFALQRTAAEPLVTDPVAMSFDADGNLYVVEMRGYSEQADDQLGRIRLLKDRDGDGVFDESLTFAEGLSWPTAITCWDGGVYVGAAPDILYLKDTNGDGSADTRSVVFTGFGRSNVQGLLNSFQWGPDNRIYGATSSSAGTITCLPHPDRPPVSLRSRDFSFDPRTLELRPESGGAQHGLSFDDWGNRFVCSNSDHAQAIIYDDRSLTRTPGVVAAPARVSIAVDGGQAEVFRISPVEPWRIVRTRLRLAGMVRGPVEGGGRAAGYFTGSTGITVYRGDAWPEEMKGTLIVGDVGSNIVHRKRAVPDGVSWEAHRIDQNAELVASADNWFRPVQFANGPDGCLHILDMYREVIEHPASLPPEIKPHLDLTSGRERGRLYRLTPPNWKPRPATALSRMSTDELVRLLDHANGWHRDTAQRLLSEQQDPGTAAAVTALLRGNVSAAGWLHALAALDGSNALTADHVLQALQHGHPRVRERATALANRFADVTAVGDAVAQLTADTDARVRLQVALTAGSLAQSMRLPVLQRLLKSDGGDAWIRSAVFSSLGSFVLPTWEQVVTAHGEYPPAAVQELTKLAARSGSGDSLGRMAEVLGSKVPDAALQTSLLRIVFAAQPQTRTHPGFHALVSALVKRSRSVLDTDTAELPQHVEAIGNLQFSTYSEDGERLLDYLQPSMPLELQVASLQTLARFGDAAIADALIRRWDLLSPELRQRSRRAFLASDEWAATMLTAIQEGRLSRSELADGDLQRLRSHPEQRIAALARAVAASSPASSRTEVIAAYQSALSMTGDPGRGEAAFRKHCSQCHRMQEIGHEVGPNLATLRNRGAATILTNVLDPNREVNPAWRDYLVVTTAGTIHNGVITAESDSTITLRRAEAKETTLLRSDIESIRDTGRSLMPEGLEKEITQQTLADIITWIMAE